MDFPGSLEAFQGRVTVRNRSAKVDAYIAKSADFARPILKKMRKLFHKGCPSIQETIKWGWPHYEHKGIVGSTAAFKRHVSFWFWKGTSMSDPKGILKRVGRSSMCAAKVTALSDLPPEKVLLAYIREAVRLNEEKERKPRRRAKKVPRRVAVPKDLQAALDRNKRARATFESFPPSHRREYVEWITEAKREETRHKRLRTAIRWMAEGKSRNWRYSKRRG